jgi:hydrocephalus-inducing protein
MINILVSGLGAKLSLVFDPEVLSMGPILPCTDYVEAKVKVSNPTHHAVEIFSLEFDGQYVDEEESLRKLEFGDGDVIYTLEKSDDGEYGDILAKSRGLQDLKDDSTGPAGVIIFGAPYSGKTTQAKRICKTHGSVYLRLDDIVDAYRQEIDALAYEQTVAGTPAGFLGEPNGALGEEGNSEPIIPVHIEQKDATDPHMSEETITEIIRARITKPDCQKHGFVIDGLDCKYMTAPIVVIRTVIKCLEKRKPILLHFQLDAASINAREIKSSRLAGDRDADLFYFMDITDDDYDKLGQEDMDKYDDCVMKYKRLRKENSARRRIERRLCEESQNDKKDGEGKKKGLVAAVKKTAAVVTATVGKEQPKPVQPLAAQKVPEARPAVRLGASSAAKPSGSANLLTASKSSLNDFVDAFFYDATLRRFESYNTMVEVIVGWLKEGDKSAIITKIPEKKPAKLKAGQTPLPSNLPDPLVSAGVQDKAEDLLSLLSEISCTPSEKAVRNTIASFLPVIETGTPKFTIDMLPPPFVEHIISRPSDRSDIVQMPKYFTLLPSCAPAHEIEDDPLTETAQTGGVKDLKKSAKGKQDDVVVKDEDEDVTAAKYRWIIPPNDQKELTLRFASSEVGKFEQQINFEIVGGRGRYSLKCIGSSQHAIINFDPRKVFTKYRKSKDERAIVHGEFILSSGVFEFGPLLQSKPKEKYLERFPENHAVFTFTNPSSTTDVKLNFGLRNDHKGETFFLDPPVMDLAPKQSGLLHVWAYPRHAVYSEDTLICCVKDNPEPYRFKISCSGVKPEIEIDKKLLSFGTTPDLNAQINCCLGAVTKKSFD